MTLTRSLLTLNRSLLTLTRSLLTLTRSLLTLTRSLLTQHLLGLFHSLLFLSPVFLSGHTRACALPSFPSQDVKNEKQDVVKQYRQLELARDALERKIAGFALPPLSSPSYFLPALPSAPEPSSPMRVSSSSYDLQVFLCPIWKILKCFGADRQIESSS